MIRLYLYKGDALNSDDMSSRMRLVDFLYTEYSLEEVIYQLAKVRDEVHL